MASDVSEDDIAKLLAETKISQIELDLLTLQNILKLFDTNAKSNLRETSDKGYYTWHTVFPYMRITLPRLKELISSAGSNIPLLSLILQNMNVLMRGYAKALTSEKMVMLQEADKRATAMCFGINKLCEEAMLMIYMCPVTCMKFLTYCSLGPHADTLTNTDYFRGYVNNLNVAGLMWADHFRALVRMVVVASDTRNSTVFELHEALPFRDLKTQFLNDAQARRLARILTQSFRLLMKGPLRQQETTEQFYTDVLNMLTTLIDPRRCQSLNEWMDLQPVDSDAYDKISRVEGFPRMEQQLADCMLAKFVAYKDPSISGQIPIPALVYQLPPEHEKHICLRISRHNYRATIDGRRNGSVHVPGFTECRYDMTARDVHFDWMPITDVQLELFD